MRTLQAVGYGTVDDAHHAIGDWSTSGGGGGSSAGGAGGPGGPGGAGASLESMLLAKNRRLEHDLTMARLATAEAEQEHEAAQAQVGRGRERGAWRGSFWGGRVGVFLKSMLPA